MLLSVILVEVNPSRSYCSGVLVLKIHYCYGLRFTIKTLYDQS